MEEKKRSEWWRFLNCGEGRKRGRGKRREEEENKRTGGEEKKERKNQKWSKGKMSQYVPSADCS